MNDPVTDLLLAAVAVAMLFLALEVRSLKKLRVSIPLCTQEHIPQAVEKPEKPEKSEYEEQYEHFLGVDKPSDSVQTEVSIQTKSSEVKAPLVTAIVLSSSAAVKETKEAKPVEEPKKSKEEKPFSMEAFVSGA